MRSSSSAFLRLAALLGIAFFAAYVWVLLTAPPHVLTASDDAGTPQAAEPARSGPIKSDARIESVASTAAEAAASPANAVPESAPGPNAAGAPPHTGALPAESHVAGSPRHVGTEVIAPPTGTDPTLTLDPQKLRSLVDRGTTAAKSDLERVKGMRLVGIAAALGSASARSLVVREFPRSAVVRAVVPPADVIRDALDPFTGDPAAGSDPAPFATLAAYFASRKSLATFAAYLVDAIRDDQRLQSPGRLTPVFDTLAGVPGACVAIARIIAVPHRDGGAECPAEFRERVLTFARGAGAMGRDAAARRIALTLMQRLDTPAVAPRSAGVPRTASDR